MSSSSAIWTPPRGAWRATSPPTSRLLVDAGGHPRRRGARRAARAGGAAAALSPHLPCPARRSGRPRTPPGQHHRRGAGRRPRAADRRRPPFQHRPHRRRFRHQGGGEGRRAARSWCRATASPFEPGHLHPLDGGLGADPAGASRSCSCATRCGRSSGWRAPRKLSARAAPVPDFKPYGATEVRRAAQAFLTMRERIERHVSQRTEMLAGVSHDLKTPLTRMKLAAGDDGRTMPTSRRCAADIAEMEHMLDEYLDFARGEGGEESALRPIWANWCATPRRPPPRRARHGARIASASTAPEHIDAERQARRRCAAASPIWSTMRSSTARQVDGDADARRTLRRDRGGR